MIDDDILFTLSYFSITKDYNTVSNPVNKIPYFIYLPILIFLMCVSS